MPLLAVFIVLLTIITMLIYVLPTARARLEHFSQYHAMAQAATVADTVNGKPTGGLQSTLDSVPRATVVRRCSSTARGTCWRSPAPGYSDPTRTFCGRCPGKIASPSRKGI